MKLSANARHVFSGRVVGVGMGRQVFVGSGLVALLCMQALAGPEGERVVNGSATFTRNGSSTVIQASNNTIIDYRSFNIGRGETVQFVQPGANARVLNRVPDAINPTRIDGTLTSNGIVYIVNSAGVYFGDRAVVTTAGIYAAAGRITNADFLSNVNHFTDMQGTVSNAGTINAQAVALIGKHAENLGTINAPRGLVTMAAGDDVYIGEVGGTMMVQVAGADASAPREGTGVNNAGNINAPGGNVHLAAGDMYSLALKMPGRITARNTKIEAQGNGTAIVSGTIDARGTRPGETGGTVQVTGDRVGLAGATIDASGPAGGGTVLIGGDFQGHGDVRTASQTVVTQNTTIRADATEQGDGGTVVVWSDQLTRYRGSISATGGAQGGDGGLVEVSGKKFLDFNGAISTAATSGRDGTILLDPQDIIIQAGPNPGPGGDDEIADGVITFPEDPGNTYTISEGALEALTGSITLQADRDITVQNGVTLDLLNLDAGESLTFRAGRNITVGGTVTTAGGDIVFTANDPGGVQADGSIIINGALSTAGVAGQAGGIQLSVIGGLGNIQLNAGLTTDGGSVSLLAPVVLGADLLIDTDLSGGATNAGNVSFSSTIDGTQALSIDARADGGGTSGDVTLQGVGDTSTLLLFRALGRTINLNGDITTTGEIRLGEIGGTVALGVPTVTIQNTGAVGDEIAIHGRVTGNNTLIVTADPLSPITLSGADIDTLTLSGGELHVGGIFQTDTAMDFTNVGAITLDAPTNFVARDSDNGNATQDITFDAANALTGAVALVLFGDDITLPAAGGSMADPASLQITATGNVTLGNVSVGSATISADDDANGTGTFTVSAMGALSSVGGVSVRAADVALDGNIVAPGQTIAIARSNDGTIGLGDAPASLVLSKAELARLAADDLVIGDSSTATDIAVDNVEAADLSLITGTVTLDATGAGGSIAFGAAASVFPALTARADDGISLGSGLTTTSGNLVLDADADNAADSSDALALGAMNTLLSAGTIVLDATTGGISAGGGTTLAADAGIAINDSFASGGSVTVNSDADSDGTGDFTLASGKTITTGDGTLAVTTAGFTLDGLVAAGTGSVTIERSTPGDIRVGGTAQMGELGVSEAELSAITSNSLVVGGTNTERMFVDALSAGATSGVAGTVQLNALADAGSISFVNGASTFRTLSANANDGVAVDHQLTTTVGDLQINANLDNADDNSDQLVVGQSVGLTAGNDLLVTALSVSLTGNAGTTNVFTSATDGNITLPGVSAPSGANLTLVAEGGITIAGAELGVGTLDATVDIDADGAAVLSVGAVHAGRLLFSGGSDVNDTIRFNLDASGTNGVTASNALAVELGGGITVNSSDGNIDLADNVAMVTLIGADNTLATLSGGAGTVTLAPVTATNNANLTIDIDGGAILTGVDLNDGDLVVNAPLSAPASSGITIVAGDVTLSNGLTTSGGGAVSITNSGVLTLSGTSPLIADGGFSQLGTGSARISGNIGSTGDTILFTGPVTLTGATTVSTGAGPGDISFLGAIVSDDANTPRNLTLNAGTGNIAVAGGIGDGAIIDQLVVESATNATFTGVVSANEVRQVAGSGTTTFNDSIIAQGSGGIDLNGSAFVFRSGVVTTTEGAGFSLTNSATADFQATSTVALAGAFVQDGTGPVNLSASITTALAPISFTGAVTIPAAVTISNNGAGNITFSNTLTTTAPVTIDGASNGSGNINFNGAVSSSGELIARTGSGAVTFGNSVTATSALTANTDSGAITFNGPLSAGGALSATSNSGSVSFASSANAGSAFSVATQTGNITFGGIVNGTAAGNGIIILNAGAGNITFNTGANVGLTNAVQRFTATARNISLRSVVTRGTTASGDGDITLSPALTVGTDNVPTGLLSINGDLVANDGNITIGGAGFSGIPSVASTVLGNPALANGATLPTITIAANAGDLVFGEGQKVTAFGNLSLVGRNITVADVTALGNLNVNAGQTLTFRQRAGSLLLGQSSADNRTDTGTNIVAGNSMAFTASAFNATGTGSAPTFATPTGVGSGLPGQYPVAVRDPFTASSLRAGTTVLSLDATGTTNTDLATALPQEGLPTNTGVGTVPAQRALDAVALAQLEELQINTRGLDPSEAREFLRGRGMYQDAVLDPGAGAGDFLVSSGRLSERQVLNLLDAYRAAFKNSAGDADGRPAYTDRSEEIRSVLAGALERFRKAGTAGTIDPVEFRRYLERTPGEGVALEHVDALGRFLRELHLLGLGPREERIARETALGKICPDGMTVRQLGELIEAQDPGLELD